MPAKPEGRHDITSCMFWLVSFTLLEIKIDLSFDYIELLHIHSVVNNFVLLTVKYRFAVPFTCVSFKYVILVETNCHHKTLHERNWRLLNVKRKNAVKKDEQKQATTTRYYDKKGGWKEWLFCLYKTMVFLFQYNGFSCAYFLCLFCALSLELLK